MTHNHDNHEEQSNQRCLDELRQIMEHRPELIVDYDPDIHRPELVGR